MYRLIDLWNCIETTVRIKDGQWVPARPMRGPLWMRAKDAYKVLAGRADAFIWPEDEKTIPESPKGNIR